MLHTLNTFYYLTHTLFHRHLAGQRGDDESLAQGGAVDVFPPGQQVHAVAAIGRLDRLPRHAERQRILVSVVCVYCVWCGVVCIILLH